jgi:hypothetical protein
MHFTVTRDLASENAPYRGSNAAAQFADPVEPAFRRDALFTLALGTFAVGTEGFMIAAILPTILPADG